MNKYFRVLLPLNCGTFTCYIAARNERDVKKTLRDLHGRDYGATSIDEISKTQFDANVEAKNSVLEKHRAAGFF